MNCDRAQELFSDHLEGSLDRGLQEALDRHFAGCPGCRNLFQSFSKICGELTSLSGVPVPADLDERIMQRLDKHFWDEKQKARSGLSWLRIALAGAAAAAVIGVGYVGYQRMSDGTIQANPIGVGAGQSSDPRVIVQDGKAEVVFSPVEDGYVRIVGEGGAVRVEQKLRAGATFRAPLDVTTERSSVVWVESGKGKAFAALVPGSKAAASLGAYQGTLIEGLRLIADYSGRVIEAHIERSDAVLVRDFSGQKPSDALETLLEGTGYEATFSGTVIVIR
jgi:hypothetical protein